MEFFLCVIGMVIFVEVFPYAAFPVKMKEWIKTVMDMPAPTLRGFGLLMMMTGLLLVYAAKG
ncbi:MAG: DUF2065 domain-containing protein [Desulfococcaceae bacterium]